MAVDLLLIGVFSTLVRVPAAVVTCVLIFILLYGSSVGTIMWLYNAEILQNKAMSMATAVNSAMNVLFSYYVPIVIKAIGQDNIGYIFIFVGALTLIASVLVAACVRETRGKTP